jgi:hypothetical protein
LELECMSFRLRFHRTQPESREFGAIVDLGP